MRRPELQSNGTYKVRFRYGVSKKTGKPRQTSERFDAIEAAEHFAKLLDVLGPAAALKATFVDPPAEDVPTLDEVAADHIKYLTGIDDGTRLDYTRLWSRTWSPLIGHLEVRPETVHKDTVADAVNKLAERYSPKSLKNQRGLLAAVMDRAVEKSLLPRNPTKGVRLPDVTVDADEADDAMVLLSVPDFDVLCTQFTGVNRAIVRFLAGSGCRWGETVVLRPRDFDLTGKQPVVRIRRALKHSGDGAIRIRGPKTKKSRRTVTLPRELLPELTALIEGKAADDFVFAGPKGAMTSHRNFWSWQWRPGIYRAQRCPDHTEASCRCGGGRPKTCPVHPGTDIPPPCNCPGTLATWLRIHDLRHTHASWLLAAGIPIHVVSRRLGHESIKTTVDTYGHLLPDAQLAAAEAAAAAFAELDPDLAEEEIQRELAGLDQLLSFLAGDDELPPALVAALQARGWTPPVLAIEA